MALPFDYIRERDMPYYERRGYSMKVDLKKILTPKVIGYAAAGLSALMAFGTALDDQAKDKTIKDLTERVAKLEKK